MEWGKILIIDASVARACGASSSADSLAIRCASVLDVIRKCGYRLGRYTDLSEEIRRHRSLYFHHWVASMYSRRAVVDLDIRDLSNLEKRVAKLTKNRLLELKKISRFDGDSEAVRDSILKDLHLLAGALVSDKIVISIDKKIRLAFDSLTHELPMAATIMWRDPRVEDYQVVCEWLTSGAQEDPVYILGSGML